MSNKNKASKNFSNHPTTGLLVVNSHERLRCKEYRSYDGTGTYAVYDIERREYVIPKVTFKTCGPNGNEMEIFGMLAAFEYWLKNNVGKKVYSVNRNDIVPASWNKNPYTILSKTNVKKRTRDLKNLVFIPSRHEGTI